MSWLKDFKKFAIRGNVMDMALGVIIGTAFAKIISSLVANVLMPPLGLLIGDQRFVNMKYILRGATAEKEAIAIEYGVFLQHVWDFILIALCVFWAVRIITKVTEKEKHQEEKKETLSKQEELLQEIRDLLKAQRAD